MIEDRSDRAFWPPRSLLALALVCPDVLKQEKWRIDQLNVAIDKHGFPKPLGRLARAFGYGLGQPFCSRDAIEQWRAQFLEFAATVKRR